MKGVFSLANKASATVLDGVGYGNGYGAPDWNKKAYLFFLVYLP